MHTSTFSTDAKVIGHRIVFALGESDMNELAEYACENSSKSNQYLFGCEVPPLPR